MVFGPVPRFPLARLAAICLSLTIELLIKLVGFLRSWQTVSHSAALHTETVRSFPKYSSTALSRVLRPQLAKARTPAVHLNSSVR